MRALTIAAKRAVDSGVAAAAILDHRGKVLALAGELDPHEARAIVAHATHQLDRAHARLVGGELLATSIAGRDARIGIAGDSVFFVVVLPSDPAAMSLVALDDLRADIEQIAKDARAAVADVQPPPPAMGSGGSSGPAGLPLVELGITVPRPKPN